MFEVRCASQPVRGGDTLQPTRRTIIAGGLATVFVGALAVPEADSASVQPVPASQAEEAAVRKYVENFESAWNRHDAVTLFGMRASEIDRINAFGGWIRDPSADERVMTRLFAGPFGQSKHKITAERIRFLTPDVALVIIHMVVGSTAGPASSLGARSLHVLVKHRGNWELTGFANVPILSPPEAIREAEGTDVLYADPHS